jgi:galactonate dehydratase
VSGVGEAGLSWRELAVAGALEHLKPAVIGQDPFCTEELWQRMFRGGFFPAQRVVSAAIAAIDIALWDIKGKALGVPVYQLLGGKVRDRVVCYPHNGPSNGDTAALVDSCRKTCEKGWKFVRWGQPYDDAKSFDPTRSVRQAVEQMKAVREALGEEIHITFDSHTRLDYPDAVRLCRELEEFAPYFIEDPLRCENHNSYRQLRAHTGVPLAVGEQYNSKWEFRQLIEEELLDYARIDLCIAGGLTEAKKIAGWCETHYIRIAPHNPLGPVSAAACLHLDLSCPNFGVQELPLLPGSAMTDIFPLQVEWKDGYLLPPSKAGLGIEFDRDAAKEYSYEAGNSPVLTREDGSFTNW